MISKPVQLIGFQPQNSSKLSLEEQQQLIDQLSASEEGNEQQSAEHVGSEEQILNVIKRKYKQVGSQTEVVLCYDKESPIIYKASGGKFVFTLICFFLTSLEL